MVHQCLTLGRILGFGTLELFLDSVSGTRPHGAIPYPAITPSSVFQTSVDQRSTGLAGEEHFHSMRRRRAVVTKPDCSGADIWVRKGLGGYYALPTLNDISLKESC